jgi:uncharacterized membrane protein (DUF4010 family)
MSWALLAAAVVAAGASALAMFRARTQRDAGAPAELDRPFSIRHALLFAFVVGVSLAAAALLHAWFGPRGIYVAAAAAGFADVHAAAVAVGQLASSGSAATSEAALALAIAFSANSVLKCVAAGAAGGFTYLRRIAPGVIGINLALLATLALVSVPS